MIKTFDGEFNKFLLKIKNKEPFAFSRFSDGELFMLQNKEICLSDKNYIVGNTSGECIYTEEEKKHFIPGKHEFHRKKLEECLQFKFKNYYKGISSRSDISQEDFDFQINIHGGDDESLTFSNLFINSNYPRYINEIVPLFSTYKNIIGVFNKNCKFDKLPFSFDKVFSIGSNCLIDDYHLVSEVSNFLKDKSDYLLLCSASTLSNFIIYECFKNNQKNTLLDVGSTLNPLLGLEGWKYSRGYLQHYWLGQLNHYGLRSEKW